MDRTVQRALERSLSRLRSGDRDLAAQYLLVVGLKHYSLLYGGLDVNLTTLEYLAGRYAVDLMQPPAGKGSKLGCSANEKTVKAKLGGRQSRPDSMFHYPFSDEVGSVPQVLHGPFTAADRLLEMGAPARKRLITRVFDEMRFSKVGLRMSDIPEALDRLGLRVSLALKKVLEGTDPVLSRSPNRVAWASAAESELWGSTERHVTLSEFSRIAYRVLQLHRQGVDAQDILYLEDLFGDSGRFGGADAVVMEGGDREGQEGAWGDSSAGEEETKRAHHRHRSPEVQVPPSASSDDNMGGNSGAQGDSTTRMSQRRQQQASGKPNDSPTNGKKAVTSKIAPIVRYDRRRHQQLAAKTASDALKTVAQRRVDALTSTAVPLGFKDRHYFSEPRLFHSKPSTRSAELASAVLHKTAPAVSNPSYRRYADLGTGMATMEIADAFLQGEVGREMLSTAEGHYRAFRSDDAPAHSAAAQRTAEALQGSLHPQSNRINSIAASGDVFSSRTFPAHTEGDARYAPNTRYGPPLHSAAEEAHPHHTSSMHISEYAAPTTVHSSHRLSTAAASHPASFGHRDLRDKRVEAQLNESAKRLYEAPGWRSAQGGWVADFGPPHTRALYTGPDIDYHTARARRSLELEGQDTEHSANRLAGQELKPWPKNRETSEGAPTVNDAVKATAQANDALRSDSLRNEAQIDALLAQSIAQSAARDADFWDDSGLSIGSGIGKAQSGGQVNGTGSGSGTAGKGGPVLMNLEGESSSDGSGVGGYAWGAGAAHYNPYAQEGAAGEDGVWEEPSGDDVEFAASLDDSVSLSAAVKQRDL